MKLPFYRSATALLAGPVERLLAGQGSVAALGVIARNFAWQSGDRIVRMGLQFLVGAVIARHLGVHDFGTLNYALAVVGLVNVFVGLGMDGLFSRDLVRHPEQAAAIMGTVFWTRTAAAALVYLGIVGLAVRQGGEAGLALLVIGLMVFSTPLGVFNAHFDVRLQARYGVVAGNISFLVCTAARLWLVARNATVAPLAATYLIEPALNAAVIYGFYRREGNRARLWRWEPARAGRFLRDGWSLLLSGLAIMVYMRLDQIMLARLRGDAEVGIFCAALRLSEVWYFIPMALASSLFPSLVRSRGREPAVYRQRLGQFYDLNAGLAYALILPLAPLAPWLFNLVYGHAFDGADTVFQIHLFACLFVFLGVARGQYLLNEGFTRFVFVSTSLGALANVGLNLVLIPTHGAAGAAVATVASQALSTLVSSFLWAPTRDSGRLQLRALALPVRAVGWLVRWVTTRRRADQQPFPVAVPVVSAAPPVPPVRRVPEEILG